MSTTAITPDGGQAVEFAGVPVKLGRQWFILPALNLGSLKRHKQLLLEISTLDIGAQMEGTTTLVLEALCRNYPDMTMERVGELIDMGNFQHLLEVTMGVSGMEKVDRLQAEAGNVVGPAGPSSTHTLPPASAGPGATLTS